MSTENCDTKPHKSLCVAEIGAGEATVEMDENTQFLGGEVQKMLRQHLVSMIGREVYGETVIRIKWQLGQIRQVDQEFNQTVR